MLNQEPNINGRRGATKQSFRAANPRALLVDLMSRVARKPGQTNADYEAELLEHFMGEAMEDHRLNATVYEYWFTNNYRSLKKSTQPNEDNIRERDLVRAKAIENANVVVKTAITRKARLMLMDLMMPNGKRLRACTGPECQKLSKTSGRWLMAISKEAGEKKVGEVLSEDRLHELYETANG